METLKLERDNKLANIIRLSDNIASVARDTIQTYATTVQGRDEILKYLKEIKELANAL